MRSNRQGSRSQGSAWWRAMDPCCPPPHPGGFHPSHPIKSHRRPDSSGAAPRPWGSALVSCSASSANHTTPSHSAGVQPALGPADHIKARSEKQAVEMGERWGMLTLTSGLFSEQEQSWFWSTDVQYFCMSHTHRTWLTNHSSSCGLCGHRLSTGGCRGRSGRGANATLGQRGGGRSSEAKCDVSLWKWRFVARSVE